MSEAIKAFFAYGPRVKLGLMVESEEIATFISGRTGFTEGVINAVLTELRDSVAFFAKSGRPVRLKGLGIYAPRIDLNGVFGINPKPDRWLKHELNVPGKFRGEVVNHEMIGQSSLALIERWNEDHPDDKIKVDK